MSLENQNYITLNKYIDFYIILMKPLQAMKETHFTSQISHRLDERYTQLGSFSFCDTL